VKAVGFAGLRLETQIKGKEEDFMYW